METGSTAISKSNYHFQTSAKLEKRNIVFNYKILIILKLIINFKKTECNTFLALFGNVFSFSSLSFLIIHLNYLLFYGTTSGHIFFSKCHNNLQSYNRDLKNVKIVFIY